MGLKDYLKKVSHVLPLFVTLKHLFIRPVTVQYPEEKIELPEGSIGLHHLDTNKCIGCGTCARVCPNKAIKLEDAGIKEMKTPKGVIKRPIKHPSIYIGRCMFCGLCIENCPTKALKFTTFYEIAGYDRKELYFSYKDLSKSR